MKVILFLMFFVSPPSAKNSPVWTLQSTSTMEFSSMANCTKAGESIQESMKTTDTITLRGWCFEDTGARVFDPATSQFKNLLPDSGSAPPPGVTIKRLGVK